jgi:hypothetical protein
MQYSVIGSKADLKRRRHFREKNSRRFAQINADQKLTVSLLFSRF